MVTSLLLDSQTAKCVAKASEPFVRPPKTILSSSKAAVAKNAPMAKAYGMERSGDVFLLNLQDNGE